MKSVIVDAGQTGMLINTQNSLWPRLGISNTQSDSFLLRKSIYIERSFSLNLFNKGAELIPLGFLNRARETFHTDSDCVDFDFDQSSFETKFLIIHLVRVHGNHKTLGN